MNATLRNHLKNYHVDEYVWLCVEWKWINQLPKMCVNTITDGSNGLWDAQNNHPHPMFSWTSFLTHIINFIVANDQVWLNKLKVCDANCFLYSLSMSLNVKSFAICSFSFVRISKTKTSHITQKFVRWLSKHGRHNSKSLRKNLQYVLVSEMPMGSLTETQHSNLLATLALQLTYASVKW